jgi:hypothetical protein
MFLVTTKANEAIEARIILVPALSEELEISLAPKEPTD